MTSPLDRVTELGNQLKELNTSRDLHQQTRDRAAWHLYANENWTNPQIRKLFGTSSHNAWLKSRERMKREHPNGPRRVESAESVLKMAVNFIRDLDAQIADLTAARKIADREAFDAGASYADIARAAGVQRQAIWVELGGKNAA